jgi:spoIIIJ-associated protein
METAEASGKTVDDALTKALARLGATRDEVEFVVLDEGKKGGLFSRGREAVVRVERVAGARQRTAAGELPDTRIPRGRGGQGQGRPQGGGGGRPPREGRGGGDRDRGPRGGGGGAPGGGGRGQGARTQTRSGFDQAVPKLTEDDFLKGPGARSEGGDAEAARPAARGRRERPSEGRPPAGEGRSREEGGNSERPERRERRPREEERNVAPDINAELVDLAAHVVDDLLRLLDIDAELTIREPLTPGDGLGVAKAVIDISGEDLGLLIGRRGDTLTAFQYLVNLIVARRYPGEGGINIDIEHYRHRREEQVVALAQRMADRVRQTGAPITLEPMSASERRLVHMAMAEDPELSTNSIGEGDNRKVVISLKN